MSSHPLQLTQFNNSNSSSYGLCRCDVFWRSFFYPNFKASHDTHLQTLIFSSFLLSQIQKTKFSLLATVEVLLASLMSKKYYYHIANLHIFPTSSESTNSTEKWISDDFFCVDFFLHACVDPNISHILKEEVERNISRKKFIHLTLGICAALLRLLKMEIQFLNLYLGFWHKNSKNF